MRCPTLDELPPPPPEKTGWPWTEESPQLPNALPDGSAWPRVSIVTPSFNQAHFIEETIRSVLLQGYPSLEYVVVDGYSSDESVAIIRKYRQWLAYWVSEPDKGQSDALNKGFAHTSGLLLDWLNSDDRFRPGAIAAIATFFAKHPNMGIVYGNYNKINQQGDIVAQCTATDFDLYWHIRRNLIPQPAAFFHRQVWEKFGPLNVNRHYVMDHELWTYAALQFPVKHISAEIADMRYHHSAKTVGQAVRFTYELEQFYEQFFSLSNLPPKIQAQEPLAWAGNYFTRGRLYLKEQQYQEARCALKQAWSYYPLLHPARPFILLFLLDAGLKTNFGSPLFRLVTWFKSGRGCFDEQYVD